MHGTVISSIDLRVRNLHCVGCLIKSAITYIPIITVVSRRLLKNKAGTIESNCSESGMRKDETYARFVPQLFRAGGTII